MTSQPPCEPLKAVTVRVPATTANLGPAYDTLGMALSIFMELDVSYAETFSFEVIGEGKDNISTGPDNMVVETCRVAFEEFAKKPMPTLSFRMRNNIPYGCGCGSSSAAAVAGFVAGMSLCGLTMATHEQEGLLNVISRIEGHPDNAAPAIYGGIQLGYKVDAEKAEDGSEKEPHVMTYRVPTPSNLSVVLFVPDKLMKASTTVTRDLVPRTVALSDAIHNVSRTAILMLALCTGELRVLKDSSDVLHEMHRSNALYPHYKPAADAARAAGADYVFLSGAGPTVCALVKGRRGDMLMQPSDERNAETVAEAMVKAAEAVSVPGHCIITQPSDLGAHLAGAQSTKPHIRYINI